MRGGPTALPFPTCSCLCPPCSCQVLDVDMAIAGHRMVGDASMVLSLERIRQYEDKNLLAAHIMVLLERDYNQAQVGSEGGGGGQPRMLLLLLGRDCKQAQAMCARTPRCGPRIKPV